MIPPMHAQLSTIQGSPEVIPGGGHDVAIEVHQQKATDLSAVLLVTGVLHDLSHCGGAGV